VSKEGTPSGSRGPVFPTALSLFLAAAGIFVLGSAASAQGGSAAGQATTAKAVGTVKAVSGRTITLALESGGEMSVIVEDAARLLRVEPGQNDLKNAAPLQLQDLQAGDRILVRGRAGDDGKSLVATSVIAMKKADIAERRAHEREEWQRHGVGGLVKAVDPAAGAVQIDTSALGANKVVTVTVSKNTVLRRYAPDSVNFDDAAPAPVGQIRVGDQLRARGTRSADGGTLTADEVVSGSFRNIAGTITGIDVSSGTITVNDLATKKPIAVKISGSSQLKKLPQPMAQRIAARMKGNSGEPQPASGQTNEGGRPSSAPAATNGSNARQASARQNGAAQPGAAQGGGTGGRRGEQGGEQGGAPGDGQGGSPDFQQAISRMPAATLTDLQKGDAVMIVATSGSQGGATAITLLAGVEPILEASPTGGQSILTPWSLSGAPGGEGAAQ
jgi:Domain of unknown function (DUF5666)